MANIDNDRIVHFTPAEISELVDFLRTFEASPKALELHQKFIIRSVNAQADVEDVADDEPYDPSKKFASVRAYPGMEGLPVTPEAVTLTTVEHEVLARIAKLETRTIDGYVKPEADTFDIARALDEKELVMKHPNAGVNIYKTSATGREALADSIISTDEPSA